MSDSTKLRQIETSVRPIQINNQYILEKNEIDKLKDKLSKLINNSESKSHFFLPAKSPFTREMIAILNLSYSFRVCHYDEMLDKRVLGLKSEFQAKVGHIIAELYGRVGTSDLSDHNWSNDKIRKHIKGYLSNLNIFEVPDKKYIDFIERYADDDASLDELTTSCRAFLLTKDFEPMKKEYNQRIKAKLFRLFGDSKEVDKLLKSGKIEKAKAIRKLLNDE